MKQTAYLSLGANLGNRAGTLEKAIRLMDEFGSVVSVSSLYETEPVETLVKQDWFLNCAVALETELTPEQLMSHTVALEEALGRRRDQLKGPRTLDIDIIFFDCLVVAVPGLTVPHPAMQRRRFVLEPLNEIAPEMRHPVLKKTVAELLAELPGNEGVVRKLTKTQFRR